jgi:hypothetical protein
VLPLIVQCGLATAEEVEMDTFAERFRQERVGQRVVARRPKIFSALICRIEETDWGRAVGSPAHW